MGSVIIIMGLIGNGILYAYLKFPPPGAPKNLLSTFNMMVLGVCTLLCFVWAFHSYSTLGQTDDHWWIPMALAGVFGIEAAFLGLCFLLRNFWIFKSKNNRSLFK